MTTLLLIRHAQSANNAQPEHLRVPDPALTDLGLKQAAALAERLTMSEVDQLYCSPFLRALLTTAAITVRTNLIPTVLPELCEQGGCYSGYLPMQKQPHPGMNRQQILQRFPGWRLSPEITDDGWWFATEFESESQATQRAGRVAHWLWSNVAPKGGVHALVIHADFKCLLLQQLLGSLPIDAIGEPFNVSLSSLRRIDNRWELMKYNAVDHVPQDLRS